LVGPVHINLSTLIHWVVSGPSISDPNMQRTANGRREVRTIFFPIQAKRNCRPRSDYLRCIKLQVRSSEGKGNVPAICCPKVSELEFIAVELVIRAGSHSLPRGGDAAPLASLASLFHITLCFTYSCLCELYVPYTEHSASPN
jgi:hypothetical protein